MPTKDNSSASILIVDDEEAIVDSLSTYLSGIGYEVRGLTDSKVALECVEEDGYDVVLTDLVMPDVTGMDIAKAFKQSGRDVKVIIFTGYASIGSAIESIKLGVYDYIRKPFELAEIRMAVERALEKLQLERENALLHTRIERMLSHVTMLYDISTILYQVPELDVALEMILDTLYEGMLIRKASIILQDKFGDSFEHVKWKDLDPRFVQEFRFRLLDKINDVSISTTDMTEIPISDSGISVQGHSVKGSHSVSHCILIPIKFLERLLGFLGIFQRGEGIISGEDEMKLLKIFATQIAPVVYPFCSTEEESRSGKLTLDIVGEAIETARSMRSCVSFVLMRLFTFGAQDEANFLKHVRSVCEKAIRGEINSTAELTWLTHDTVLISLPAANPVSTEFTCMRVRRSVEELEIQRTRERGFLIRYAYVCFPYDGNTASEIVNGLWYRLFEELQMTEGHFQKI